MDLINKKLRKFLTWQLVKPNKGKGKTVTGDVTGSGAVSVDCQRSSENSKIEEMGRMRKMKKFLRWMGPEKLSSMKSQDRKQYAAIMTLLVSNRTQSSRTEVNKPEAIITASRDQWKEADVCEQCRVDTYSERMGDEEASKQFAGVGFAETEEPPPSKNMPASVSNQLKNRFLSITINRLKTEQPLGLKFANENNTIEAVKRGSPAAIAGLRPGDKVVAIDGRRLEDDENVGRILERIREPKLDVERMEDQNGDEVESVLLTCMLCDLHFQDPVETRVDPNSFDSSTSTNEPKRDCDQYIDDDEKEYSLGNKRYPKGTIIDRFPEARAFLRLMGRSTYSHDFRDFNIF